MATAGTYFKLEQQYLKSTKKRERRPFKGMYGKWSMYISYSNKVDIILYRLYFLQNNIYWIFCD